MFLHRADKKQDWSRFNFYCQWNLKHDLSERVDWSLFIGDLLYWSNFHETSKTSSQCGFQLLMFRDHCVVRSERVTLCGLVWLQHHLGRAGLLIYNQLTLLRNFCVCIRDPERQKKRLLLQDEKKKWFYTHSGLYKNYEGWEEGQAVVILLLSKKGSLSVLHTFIQLFTFLCKRWVIKVH